MTKKTAKIMAGILTVAVLALAFFVVAFRFRDSRIPEEPRIPAHVPLKVTTFLGTEAILDSAEGAITESEIDSFCSDLNRRLNEKLTADSYNFDEEAGTLVLVKGWNSGLTLDCEMLKETIISALQSEEKELQFTELQYEPELPDFTPLREKICREPENAKFSEDGSHEILPAHAGYRFDLAELEERWDEAAYGEEITVPVERTEAPITKEILESRLYRNLLGAVTTKYNNSGENRCSNVRLAAEKVNGTVLFPGEEFSFNRTVGKRTAEAGFLMAPAYAGYDDIQEEIGGGVCQVSTGIYASALYAFLEITSHTCHVYPPNYIQLGCDSTVSMPESGREIDMKFRNSKNYPIKIVAYCQEGVNEETGKPLRTVTVELWGTLEEGDYMPVEFDNRYGDIYDYDRVVEPADPDRQGYRLLFTHDETEFEDDTGKGLRTLTYIRIYDTEGNLVDKKLMNREYSFGYGMDTYYYMQ